MINCNLHKTVENIILLTRFQPCSCIFYIKQQILIPNVVACFHVALLCKFTCIGKQVDQNLLQPLAVRIMISFPSGNSVNVLMSIFLSVTCFPDLNPAAVSWISWFSENSLLLGSSTPASILEISMMSFISSSRCWPLRWIIPIYSSSSSWSVASLISSENRLYHSLVFWSHGSYLPGTMISVCPIVRLFLWRSSVHKCVPSPWTQDFCSPLLSLLCADPAAG